MQSHEYSLHILKVRYNEETAHSDVFGDRVASTFETVERVMHIVAPNRAHTEQHFGHILIKMILDENFRFFKKLPDGGTYTILDHREEKLDEIIRLNHGYRAQW